MHQQLFVPAVCSVPIRPNKPKSLVLSVVLHALAVAALMTLSFAPQVAPRLRTAHVPLVAPAPHRPVARARPVLSAPRRAPVAAVLRLPVQTTLPRPVAPLIADAPAIRNPEIRLPEVEIRMAPAPAPVRVAEFATVAPAVAPAAAPPPRSLVIAAGFATAESGATGAAKRVVAQESGFGGSAVGAAAVRPAGRVGSSGFGDSVSGSAASPVARASSPAAGFATVAAEPARMQRARAAEGVFSGVEILDKPRPQYTEEARRLQIEGVVQLDILFAASGEVRVLSVVRGLGHGLDENATRAARAIRFRPAQRDGRAVDSTASVQIVFQLAS